MALGFCYLIYFIIFPTEPSPKITGNFTVVDPRYCDAIFYLGVSIVQGDSPESRGHGFGVAATKLRLERFHVGCTPRE